MKKNSKEVLIPLREFNPLAVTMLKDGTVCNSWFMLFDKYSEMLK